MKQKRKERDKSSQFSKRSSQSIANVYILNVHTCDEDEYFHNFICTRLSKIRQNKMKENFIMEIKHVLWEYVYYIAQGKYEY